MRWYFERSWWMPLRLLLLVLLLCQFAGAIYCSCSQTLGMLRLIKAFWGIIPLLLLLLECFVWFFFTPLWMALLSLLAVGDWFRNEGRRAVIYLVAMVAAINVIYFVNGWLVMWVADRDPDLAWSVGVTGSRPRLDLQPVP